MTKRPSPTQERLLKYIFEYTAKTLNIFLPLVLFWLFFVCWIIRETSRCCSKALRRDLPSELPGECFMKEKLKSLLQLVRAQNPEQ